MSDIDAFSDYKEYNTDQTVKFVVRMNAAKLRYAEEKGLHSVFKLQSIINTTSMVLFDADGCLRKFERVEEIMEEFFRTRRRKYHERKKFLEGILLAQSSRLSNQARFILEKIKGDIVLENKKKSAIVAKLIERHYDPDPVKKWKETQRKLELADTGDAEDDEVL
jgi:DNA topoisomerase-2